MFHGEVGLLCSRSRSQQNFKLSVNACPDDIFWNAEPFTTKPGMVMHHYQPECSSKRLVCCLQGQGHNYRWYNQNMPFYILSELLILLQLKLVRWHIIIRWIVLWKDLIALLRSKSRSQKRLRISVSIHLEDISSAADLLQPNLVWWCNIMGQRRLVCCHQVQSHSDRGLI